MLTCRRFRKPNGVTHDSHDNACKPEARWRIGVLRGQRLGHKRSLLFRSRCGQAEVSKLVSPYNRSFPPCAVLPVEGIRLLDSPVLTALLSWATGVRQLDMDPEIDGKTKELTVSRGNVRSLVQLVCQTLEYLTILSNNPQLRGSIMICELPQSLIQDRNLLLQTRSFRYLSSLSLVWESFFHF